VLVVQQKEKELCVQSRLNSVRKVQVA